MASVEKLKKKKSTKGSAAVAKLSVKDDAVSMSGSVISVREATTSDQHVTVEKGSVEEAQTKSPSSRPTSATSHRPMSAQRNLPLPNSEAMGSTVSLQSRQAWGEVDNTPGTLDLRPSSAGSRISANRASPTSTSGSQLLRPNNAVSPMPEAQPTSARPATNNSRRSVTSSANTNTTVEPFESGRSSSAAEMNEAHAYVPYLYARGTITKVVSDMKNMKLNHIRIVHDIEDNFRCIENETQAQFNMFVLNLRDQYGVKVKTFRQVIEVHRLELQQKDQYWEELLMSLSQRNTDLLKDKKMLLIQNKVEFERLEREKKETTLVLTTKLDGTNAANAKNLKEIENKHEERIKELEAEHDKEKKVMSDAQEAKQMEVERLKRLLEEVEPGKSDKTDFVPPGAILIGMQDENKEMEARLKKAEKEKKGIQKELNAALKAHAKSTLEAETANKLLAIAVREVREVNRQVEKASELINERLKALQVLEEGAQEEDHALTLKALEMLDTGAVPEKITPVKTEVKTEVALPVGAIVSADAKDLEEKIMELQENIEELTTKNDKLEESNKNLGTEVSDLKDKLIAGASLDPKAVAVLASSGDDLEELSGQISELQQQVDEAEARFAEEKSAHAMTRDELETVQAQLEALKTELEEQESIYAANMEATQDKTNSEISNLTLKLQAAEKRVEQLEKARLNNVPVDTRKEIKALKGKLAAAVRDKDAKEVENVDLQSEIKQMNVKMAALEKSSGQKKEASSDSDRKLKEVKAEKDRELKEAVAKYEKREKERAKQEEKKLAALEKKIFQLEVAAASFAGATAAKGGKPDKAGPDKATMDKLREAQKELKESQNKIKELDKELKDAQKLVGAGSMEAEREKKKQEKVLKELEKKLDLLMKKDEKNEANLKKQAEELDAATKENTAKDREIAKLKSEMEGLGAAAAEGLENAVKVKELSRTVKELTGENNELTQNYNSERVLRKKYYNMVEDMKGKIRVYCRVRPMSNSETARGCENICKSPDEYTIHVERDRGMKEFQFDNIFMPEVTQERVFEDTNNLVQSAVDGYNVCIFAYGQTGSGKTYTVIGDSSGKSPGIAPRAFERIYELAEEQKSKFSFVVSVYMLELYNDRLLDLFTKGGAEDKMEIRKDKKGMVVIQGAEIKSARSSTELYSLFEEGSKNRHTASTKMNAESSRSHLVIGIVIESTNKVSGQVIKGKLSLVDLAGSERASKTESSAEQLKEAMSINKSLSALGDVISALSSEQSFIPYRNNKLTMLMQDSLGGNAKTLMFVNVSPADYNADETVTSLMYAARVKLITNDASKNADNKEIARLKAMIAKLKKGEDVADEEATDEDVYSSEADAN